MTTKNGILFSRQLNLCKAIFSTSFCVVLFRMRQEKTNFLVAGKRKQFSLDITRHHHKMECFRIKSNPIFTFAAIESHFMGIRTIYIDFNRRMSFKYFICHNRSFFYSKNCYLWCIDKHREKEKERFCFCVQYKCNESDFWVITVEMVAPQCLKMSIEHGIDWEPLLVLYLVQVKVHLWWIINQEHGKIGEKKD